jgi:hypothetical protein
MDLKRPQQQRRRGTNNVNTDIEAVEDEEHNCEFTTNMLHSASEIRKSSNRGGIRENFPNIFVCLFVLSLGAAVGFGIHRSMVRVQHVPFRQIAMDHDGVTYRYEPPLPQLKHGSLQGRIFFSGRHAIIFSNSVQLFSCTPHCMLSLNVQ